VRTGAIALQVSLNLLDEKEQQAMVGWILPFRHLAESAVFAESADDHGTAGAHASWHSADLGSSSMSKVLSLARAVNAGAISRRISLCARISTSSC
jgi:hypothetical protein